MMRFVLLYVFFTTCVFSVDVLAGLINVNFTSTLPTGGAFDGDGALGGGVWNRIVAVSGGMADDAGDSNRLKDSAGGTLAVRLTAARSGAIAGVTAANDNLIQSESWVGNSPGALIFVDVDGLVAGQVYKVVVYSNRVGSGAPADNYLMGPESVTMGNPGATATAPPGQNGVDYLIFYPTANSSGGFTLITQAVAAMQISGRITKSEKAPRLDASITKNPASPSGKGAGNYDTKATDRQTLSRKGRRKKAFKFYANVTNKGAIIDNPGGTLTFREKDLKVVARDLTSGENITAALLSGENVFRLDAGETHRLQIQLKPLRENKKLLIATLFVLPSTKDKSSGDVVSGQIKFR